MSQNSTEVLTPKLRDKVWVQFTQHSSKFSKMKAGGDETCRHTGRHSAAGAICGESARAALRGGRSDSGCQGHPKNEKLGAHSLVSFTQEESEVTTGTPPLRILRCRCPTSRQGLRSQHPQGRLQPPALKKSELLSGCCESLRCAKQMVPRLSAEAEPQMASFGDTLKCKSPR